MNMVLKLHDGKVELPEKSCNVLMFNVNDDGSIRMAMNVCYSDKHKKFNCKDYEDKAEAKQTWMDVDYWAYLTNINESKESEEA